MASKQKMNQNIVSRNYESDFAYFENWSNILLSNRIDNNHGTKEYFSTHTKSQIRKLLNGISGETLILYQNLIH